MINQFTGQQVASGTLQTVTTAQPDSSSGDYVYRIDLSGVPAGGPYRIIVSGYGCSYPFGVGGDFSERLGYVAFRALYYQRCGCPIVQPYAWANIRPYPCHTNIYDDEYAGFRRCSKHQRQHERPQIICAWGLSRCLQSAEKPLGSGNADHPDDDL